MKTLPTDRFTPPPDDERRAMIEFEEQGRAEGKPSVALSFNTHWCPTHLRPYRKNWPAGAGLAMVKLFQAATEDGRIQEMAGGDVERLSAVLAEVSPLCCYIETAALERIYAETREARRRGR